MKKPKRAGRPSGTAARVFASTSSRAELGMLLNGLRLSRGLNLREIASAAKMRERRVSFIEEGGDAFVSEIRRYAVALGCELRLECERRRRSKKLPAPKPPKARP